MNPMQKPVFPAAAASVKSPRLRWMEKHKVNTRCSGMFWFAGKGEPVQGQLGCGKTEDDAITAWSKANGVRLWTEE